MIYMPNVSFIHGSLARLAGFGKELTSPSLAWQTQSQEKIDLLRMLGAEVHPVPGEP